MQPLYGSPGKISAHELKRKEKEKKRKRKRGPLKTQKTLTIWIEPVGGLVR
jgi:hypothetical protein